jgi:hypothetical protein
VDIGPFATSGCIAAVIPTHAIAEAVEFIDSVPIALGDNRHALDHIAEAGHAIAKVIAANAK